MPVYRLQSHVKPYAWGTTGAISEILGRAPSKEREAELWMGAHPLAPSPLAHPENDACNLAELISARPVEMLGEDNVATFGRLPFLFKILAAEEPLSLQAHPTREQALIGFQKEQQAGVPLDAPFRLYKDDSHKPELICALTPFYALSGFRSPEECLVVSEAFGCDQGDDALAELFAGLRWSCGLELEAYFRGLFGLERSVLRSAILRATRLAREATLPPMAGPMAPWLLRLAELHPDDPGVLASLLLNLVALEPGQAMFLPAGNLHAYLSGVGLELMASSDNVLRGGLTSKHVDVAELARILNFSPFAPVILEGEDIPFGEGSIGTWHRFPAAATEFELSLMDLVDGTIEAHGPEIWLVLEGRVEISDGAEQVEIFDRGSEIFLPASPSVRVHGRARLARAAIPPL